VRGEDPWTLVADGVVVTVRLTPRAGQDSLDGIRRLDDGRAVLQVRVRAAPSEGEANASLKRLLAGALRVAPSRVELVSGASARVKRVKIAGEGGALAASLAALAGPHE